ncbi:MAG: DUF5723 family protein [Salinivirgaceae bacterium]|jgi:hypothetical protein|nr:DUF5723 family protein [Salinivirgaceae bacterium]
MKTCKKEAMVKRYILPIILLFTMGLSNAFAQENISMYNMRTLPQTSKLNPAFQPDYNGHVGGLITVITPVFGQITPNIDLNFHSSSFGYDDFIYKGTGIYSDSLVWALNSQEDAVKFVDKLDELNHLSVDFNLNILNVGFRTRDIYWNLTISNKTALRASFPGGLMELIVKGNASPDISSNVNLSGLGVDAMNYMEYGIGASRKILPELTVGVRLKALAGIANVETLKTDLNFGTYDNEIVLESDIHMRMSQPAIVLDDLYYDFEGDSLVSETTERESDEIISDLGYDFANPGMAIDIGAEYDVMPEVKVFASVTDIGFIKWNTNVAEVKGGGKFRFEGIDGVQYLGDNNDTTDNPNVGDTYQDSLLKVFDIKKTDTDSYKTWMPSRLYLGGTYQLTDVIGFGALYRGSFYSDDYNSAFSFSANANLDYLSASVTYTMMEDNFDNIGIGIAGRVGPFQMYVVSDHVLEEIFPQTARDVNIRMGLNWLIGYKRDRAALIEPTY